MKISKSEKLIKELEAELEEYCEQTKNMDLNKVDDARLAFARLSFYYQAQAFTKVLKRLDEIKFEIKKLSESK